MLVDLKYINEEMNSLERENSLEEHEESSIAIQYFENLTGVAELDFWKKGLAELLKNTLLTYKKYKIIDLQIFYSSDEEAIKNASELGVNFVLVGNYFFNNDTLCIHIRLLDVKTKQALATDFMEISNTKDIYKSKDNLAMLVIHLLEEL